MGTKSHSSLNISALLRDYASRHGDYPPGHVVWMAASEIEQLVEQYENLIALRDDLTLKAYERGQEVERLKEQLEAANARKQELWTRLLDMENKYMDAYQRAADATEQYTKLLNASSPASTPEAREGGDDA